jgi:hypothetical protein
MLGAPPLAVTWLRPGSAARATVGGSMAVYLRARQAIATPALVSLADYAVALHECGRHRANQAGDTRLQDEITAWQWAMTNPLAWEQECHDRMCRSLNSYLADAKLGDVIEVDAIEHLLSADVFQWYHKPLKAAVHTFEDREFKAQHGHRSCFHCRAAAVMAIDGWQMFCRSCGGRVEIERAITAVKRSRGNATLKR